MIRVLLQPFEILMLLVVLLAGCSSFHNVSIIGSGEELMETLLNPPPSSPPLGDQTAIPASPLIDKGSPSSMSDDATPPKNSPLELAIATQSADDAVLPSSLKDIFFDYDQYTIRTEGISALELNAKVLLQHYSGRQVLIEGHCDERGTEEYNFILGDRRARVVKNYLIHLGVPASNLQVISMGKNEPFCFKPSFKCFQQNRRAHFVLK